MRLHWLLSKVALPYGKSSFVRFKPLFSFNSELVSPPRPQRLQLHKYLSPGLLKIPEEQSCLATSIGSKNGCPLVLFASTFLHLLPFPSCLQQ